VNGPSRQVAPPLVGATWRYRRTVPSPTPARTVPSWPNLSRAARDVLLEVLIHGTMSRAEIASRLNLSRPTLTRLARTLVGAGLLAEGGTELRSATGRPSELVYVRGAAHHFLAMKLTADRLYAALTDLTATVVEHVDEPLGSTDPAAVAGQIADIASRHPELTGIGVTLGGVARDGVVVEAGFLEGPTCRSGHWSPRPPGCRPR
jgi:predicted transcriptional regulator